MTEDPQRHDINVNLSFTPAPPRPKRRRRLFDVLSILFAAALIGTATGNSGTVFAVVAALAIFLYIVHKTHPADHPAK